jgi:hypothetical protein
MNAVIVTQTKRSLLPIRRLEELKLWAWELTGATAVTELISPISPPVKFDTKSSLRLL